MAGGISKRLSKVRQILHKKRCSREKLLVLDCSAESSASTESLLSQLEQARLDHITHLTLNDSLQRSDNVRLFTALSNLVSHDSCKLRQICLLEPRIRVEDYRRWCFKKTNFLKHVYQDCQARQIEVKIQGTLLFETPENKEQDVSTWVSTHLPKTIPQDHDITSLSISLRDVKPKTTEEDDAATTTTSGRASLSGSLRRGPQSDVERVFQGLIDVFNNNDRPWDFVSCNVMYTVVPKYAAPQTECLLEVAQIYDVPLVVKWEPVDANKKAHGTWTRTTRQAKEILELNSNNSHHSTVSVSSSTTTPSTAKKRIFPSNPPRTRGGGGGGGKSIPPVVVEDNTSSMTDYEGSSGQMMY